MTRFWNSQIAIAVLILTSVPTAAVVQGDSPATEKARSLPHIILVMADDQGWGETSYNGHPLLKTPNLDAMARRGVRFNRFYAGAPVCSPTRATVLTGRTNDRTGTLSHGYALRRQEITLAQVLRSAGYVTSHFGKWHLNGLRGPGVPILRDDSHHPGQFGFDHWFSVTNFFDRDPILSRMGKFEDHSGDSSEVVVDQALGFLRSQLAGGSPTFTVIWFGTPHSPFKASEPDMADFQSLGERSKHHYGELVAMDRSIGTLQNGLKRLGIDQNTLVWFCSDNGGLPNIRPTTVGPLRGYKNTIYEGGLRVPAIIRWPEQIRMPHQTDVPASVADILPTLLTITSLSHPDPNRPTDGINLWPLIRRAAKQRSRPIFFRQGGRAALIDNEWKLLTTDSSKDRFELYNVTNDVSEQDNLMESHRETYQRLRVEFDQWNRSVDASHAGKDYPEGEVNANEPEPHYWSDVTGYQQYLDQWRRRWQYGSWLKQRGK